MLIRSRNLRLASSSVKRTAMAILLGASVVTGSAPQAHASAPICLSIVSNTPELDEDAALFHDLSAFDAKDGTRAEILAMKKELAELRHANRNYLLPRHYKAEVSLILFQDLLIGGDYEIAKEKYSTLFEETEGNYVLMRMYDAIADKLVARQAAMPAAKQAKFQAAIDSYRAKSRLARTSFMDHRSEYFSIRTDLELTISKGAVQQTADVMNIVEAEELTHDTELDNTENTVAKAQPVAATFETAMNSPLLNALLPPTTDAANAQVVNATGIPNGAALQTQVPILVPGTILPTPMNTDVPVAAPNAALVLGTAKKLDRTFSAYLHSDYFTKQLAEARKALGADYQLTRPSLAELQTYDRIENNTTEAIVADLQTQIQEQKALRSALWLKSQRAFDLVGRGVDRLPLGVRQTAQAFLTVSADNAVRRTFFRDILAVMREPAEGLDPSRRVDKLFNLAVKYPDDDGLLIAYARVVRSMESWHQMKEFVKSRAFVSPDNTSSSKDTNYGRKYDRLIAAEKKAEARGDLSLTEDVAPAYLKGLVIWTGAPGAIAAYESSHGHVIASLHSWALTVLPTFLQ